MPVVRIDSEGDLSRKPPPEAVAGKIAEWAAMPGARAVQIDFDARASERDWYRALLREVRARLPKQQSLSMTALASWCEPDGWMADLPVDEAIPMLFRMGRGEAWTGGEPAAPLCRGSAGVSTDELPPHLPPARRIYFFHPGSWTKSDYDAAWLVSRARITGRRPWE